MRHTLDGLTLADLLQNHDNVAEMMRQRLTSTLTEPVQEHKPLLPLNVKTRPVGVI
jgi:hypothetical protein